jgi:hypothetical protein
MVLPAFFSQNLVPGVIRMDAAHGEPFLKAEKISRIKRGVEKEHTRLLAPAHQRY